MDNLKTIKIFNGKIIRPEKIIEGGSVLITGGIITAVSEKDIKSPDAFEVDAQGKYISPGFIDIHVHGGGGYDFMDGSENAFLKIAETHARYGTTAMLPTTLSSTKEEILHTLDLYEVANRNNTNGVAKLPDRSAFAGSIATADMLVRTMISLGGVSLTDSVKMMTSTPARIMGISGKKGEIAVGKDADIIIFDSNINVAMTMIGGKII